MAFQSELLEVKPGDKILEIGTGSGYQAAVLCVLGAHVYSIERQLELFKKTSKFLPKIGYVAKRLVFGDGYKGLPDEAPFDRIIVTAGAPFVPKPLLSQLKIGGRLVIPVGDVDQIMTLYIRKGAKEFEKHELAPSLPPCLPASLPPLAPSLAPSLPPSLARPLFIFFMHLFFIIGAARTSGAATATRRTEKNENKREVSYPRCSNKR